MIATVGTFDGVHRGHRYLLERLRSEAEARGLKPLAVTFSRHPLSLVDPDRVPPALSTPDERDRMIRSLGVEVLRLDFTPELRALTGRGFVEMLRRDHGVCALLTGFNNHLGCDRDPRPQAEGVELITCPELPHHARVSSSAIRNLIARGRMAEANEMLGRPYSLSGEITGGRQLGRTIGFPTANLAVPAGLMLPAPGVYAARMLGRDAVVNVGSRPTVAPDGAPISVEAHIIGFSGNLYGRTERIDFIRRLRDERRFPTLSELKSAIGADISATLNQPQPWT